MAERRLVNCLRLLRFMASEMTQAELGERIGVTRQTIAAIEAGKYSPTLETAFRIAEVFGKPLEEVFQWERGTPVRTTTERGGHHGPSADA